MKVGITGITGFVGSQVCKLLLEKGNYVVRGSVRSLKNAKKMQPLKDAFGDNYDKCEIFEADLTNEQSIYDFVKGCDYVIHVASPFPEVDKKIDEEAVMKPAVEGTLRVLRASNEFGVKRVVCTSSLQTIRGKIVQDKVYTENDMPEPEEAFNFYGKSKIVAERKSWEYISEIKKHGSNLELITLHPGGIIGPTLTKDTSFTSMQMIKKCFSGEYPRLPFISSSYTDVRDLALMHYNALQVPILDTNCHINDHKSNSNNPNLFERVSLQRYIVANEPYFAHEIGEWLTEDFKDSGYKPTTKNIPYPLAYFLSIFNPALAQCIPIWGKRIQFDNSKAKKYLDYNPIPVRDSVKDMIESLFKQGYLERKSK